MENRERRPAGFKFQPHEFNRVAEAFITPHTIIKDSDRRLEQLRKAADFLNAVQNRASKRGLTPEGSVNVIITAKIQDTKEDLSRALDNLAETAAESGLEINEEATQENPGSIVGSIALKKAPDLAIGMYKNSDLFVMELPRLGQQR